jgi:predicted enzyme related to lactoylglutathione lyase
MSRSGDGRLTTTDDARSSGRALDPEEAGMQLNGILMGSDDPKRLTDYYRKLFGEPQYEDGGYSTWMFGSGSISIGAHSEVSGSNAQPGRLIWNLETPDVKSEFERLKGAGAVVVKEPYNFEEYPDAWIATLADPDGNYFQLMTPFDPASMGS